MPNALCAVAQFNVKYTRDPVSPACPRANVSPCTHKVLAALSYKIAAPLWIPATRRGACFKSSVVRCPAAVPTRVRKRDTRFGEERRIGSAGERLLTSAYKCRRESSAKAANVSE